MEEKKKNKKTYAFIGLGVLGAIVITLGITYAYWRLTREQTNENVVTTACLDVDIESQQDDINLPKAYPISDEDGESLVPFKFTIHNKCEDIARYQINLESMSKKDGEEILEAQRLNPKYLKYKINEVGKNGKIGLLTGEKDNDTTKVAPTIKMYEYERSKNNGKQLCESQDGTYCNDEETRTYTWRGKVGLMYPSDYGYATSGGSEDTRSKCLKQNLYFWKNYNPDEFVEETDHPNCYENDWLLPTSADWTIAPGSYSNTASTVFDVSDGGTVGNVYADYAYGVRPTIYLTSNVIALNGEGTKENPWILGIE